VHRSESGEVASVPSETLHCRAEQLSYSPQALTLEPARAFNLHGM